MFNLVMVQVIATRLPQSSTWRFQWVVSCKNSKNINGSIDIYHETIVSTMGDQENIKWLISSPFFLKTDGSFALY